MRAGIHRCGFSGSWFGLSFRREAGHDGAGLFALLLQVADHGLGMTVGHQNLFGFSLLDGVQQTGPVGVI